MCWITFDVKSRLEPCCPMIHCWCVFGRHSPHVIVIFPNMTIRKSMQVRNILKRGLETSEFEWHNLFKLNIYIERTFTYYFVAVGSGLEELNGLLLDIWKLRKKEQKDINSEGQHNVKRIKTLPVKFILKDSVTAETLAQIDVLV